MSFAAITHRRSATFRRIWRALAYVWLSVFGLLVLVVLSLNLSFSRNFIRRQVNRALSQTFAGQLVIDRIGGLRLDVVSGVDARVLDAKGNRVIEARGLRVSSNWPELVLDLVRGRPLTLRLSPASIDHVEINVIDDGTGALSLAGAFSPRHPKPATKKSGQPLSIDIDGLEMRHVWAHGGLASLPVIDSEIHALKGSLQFRQSGLWIRVANGRVELRALPRHVDPSGSITASLHLPLDGTTAGSGTAAFSGKVASAPATVRAEWQGQMLNASLDASNVPPSAVKAQLPNSKFEHPLSLEARIHGQLPKLAFDAHVTSEAAAISIRGQTQFGQRLTASCELSAANVNLGPILGSADRTQLTATLSAHLDSAHDGAVQAIARGRLGQGTFNGIDTPSVDFESTLKRDQRSSLTVIGTVSIREPGAPILANYVLRAPSDAEPTFRASFDARLRRPPRLRNLSELLVDGEVSGRAEYRILSRHVSAELRGTFSPLFHAKASARRLELQVTALGPLDAPSLHLVADADRIQTRMRGFKHARFELAGTPRQVHLDGTLTSIDSRETIRISTHVISSNAVVLQAPRVAVSDSNGVVEVRAERVALQDGVVELEGLTLTGAGVARASGSFGATRVDTRFSAENLDVARLLRLAQSRFVNSGKLSVKGNLTGSFDDLRGQVSGTANDIAFRDLRGGQLAFDMRAEHRTFNGSLEGRIGHSQLQAILKDLHIPGRTTTRSLLRDVRGLVEVQGSLSLSELQKVLFSTGAPIESAGGKAEIALSYQHANASANSTLHLALRTRHLRLVEQREQSVDPKSPSQARQAEPRALEGVDIDANFSLEPAADRAQLHFALIDTTGLVVSLDAESKAPNLFSPALVSDLQTLPFKVVLRAPEHALEKLPRIIRPSVIRGLLTFDLEAEGTLLEPRGTAHLAIRRMQSRESNNFVDFQADTQYSNAGGALEANARSTRGGVATLHSSWQGDLARRVRNPVPDSTPLQLQSELVLHRFPLGIVPQLADRQVHGPLSGEVHLVDLGRDARLDANIDGSGIRVNRVRLSGLTAKLSADNQKLTANIDLAQARGSAHAEFSTSNTWGSRLLPQVDPHARATFTATGFQLATLSPFAMQYVSTLEGRLDANVTAVFGADEPRISGTLSVADGVLQVPTIGQRFSEMSIKAAIHDGQIDVNSLSAKGITGRFTASASARIVGTRLSTVKAQVDIKEKEKLPVTFEGANVGEAWGHVDFSYSHPETSSPTDIHVDVPRFTLKMPETAQASVEQLTPADNIRIGAHRADGRFVEIPMQPLKSATTDGEPPQLTRIFVHLGDSVWIERDRQVRVQLGGDLEIASGEQQRVQGKIELRGGKLDVSGKQFEIERGVVTFDGPDPSNPTVTATARWDSPANYTVYADYLGSVKDGQLKLHSDPSLSQDEILSLILFGTPEGSIASSSTGNGAIGNIVNASPGNTQGNPNGSGPSGAGAAVSVAGGTATQGLNRAISDVTNLDVSTRIDTSTGSARPELVVQLTPRLTTRVTRALGEPAPGQSPDRTFVTLELRLRRAWSLSAIVGDHGASTLDLIWRKRY